VARYLRRRPAEHAVAVPWLPAVQAGLALMDRITELDGYYCFHSARADLLRSWAKP